MLENYISKEVYQLAGFKIPSQISLTTFLVGDGYENDIALNVFLGHFKKDHSGYNIALIQRVRDVGPEEKKNRIRDYYLGFFEGKSMEETSDYHFDEFLQKIKDEVKDENKIDLIDLEKRIKEKLF